MPVMSGSKAGQTVTDRSESLKQCDHFALRIPAATGGAASRPSAALTTLLHQMCNAYASSNA